MIWGVALSGGAVLWLLHAERRAPRQRRVAKPLASAGFVVVALSEGAADTAFGRWMLVGLMLSFMGDVLLLGERSSVFLGGLGAFLLAHVAYSTGFVVRGVDAGGTLAAVPFGLLALGVLGWLEPHVRGPMRGPVVLYAIVISVMEGRAGLNVCE